MKMGANHGATIASRKCVTDPAEILGDLHAEPVGGDHVPQLVKTHRDQDREREGRHSQPVQHQAPSAAVAIIRRAWARAHASAASTSSTVPGSAKSGAAASTASRVSTMPRKGSRPDTNAATHSSLAAL